jgi:hypothetical protein
MLPCSVNSGRSSVGFAELGPKDNCMLPCSVNSGRSSVAFSLRLKATADTVVSPDTYILTRNTLQLKLNPLIKLSCTTTNPAAETKSIGLPASAQARVWQPIPANILQLPNTCFLPSLDINIMTTNKYN